MGVVIGETAEIGDNVTMYQGVTLGGTGFATGKRHPTVQDNVTIGSGAKLLGPITIGHGAKIGANTVVIHDVPPNSTVVGNPGHPVRVEGRRPEGPDADWVHLPDPIADALKQMARRIAELEREVADAARRGARRTRPRSCRCAPRAARAPRRVAWGLVPSFSHTVELPRPPAEVFPWLLEEDKVPRWTGDLESYYASTARSARRARCARCSRSPAASTLDMEITRYDPPRGAETRFATNGVKVVSAYALEPTAAGTRADADARRQGGRADRRGC